MKNLNMIIPKFWLDESGNYINENRYYYRYNNLHRDHARSGNVQRFL